MLEQHLEKLIHFCGVARAGSIRHYAVSHNLSQPAISKTIQTLEEELEATLFIRSRLGVELTQAGQELLSWAEATLSQAKELEQKIKIRSNLELNGQLVMGTYQSIAVYFFPKFFKFIGREHKNLQIHFLSAASGDLVTMLKNGRADFIVSVDPPRDSQFFHTELFTDNYSLYQRANTNLKLSRSSIFTVSGSKDSQGRKLFSYLKAAKLDAQVIECGEFETAKAMLEADAGFALLPDRVARSLHEAKVIDIAREVPSLIGFGRHSVVFSCKAHRASESSIKWVASQLQLMLRH